MTEVTRERLEQAIDAVLGVQMNDAMKHGNLNITTRHKAACDHAFMHAMTGEDVDVLRAALLKLQTTGMY